MTDKLATENLLDNLYYERECVKQYPHKITWPDQFPPDHLYERMLIVLTWLIEEKLDILWQGFYYGPWNAQFFYLRRMNDPGGRLLFFNDGRMQFWFTRKDSPREEIDLPFEREEFFKIVRQYIDKYDIPYLPWMSDSIGIVPVEGHS